MRRRRCLNLRREVTAISLRTSSRFTPGGAAPQRTGVGILVSFLEKRRGPGAEPGMMGTYPTGRRVYPPNKQIIFHPVFHFLWGSFPWH